MDELILSLVNLDSKGCSGLVGQLRSIFESAKAPVRLLNSGETSETGPLRTVGENRQAADVLVVVLPCALGDTERLFIRTWRTDAEHLPIIAVIESANAADLMALFELGVTDLIAPPLKAIDLLPRIWRIHEHVRRKRSMIERLKETLGLRQMIGTSPSFTTELQKIPLVAGCDSCVLITGETGTGKEMFARAIHYLGPRSAMPFIPVNCGAIPPDLIENELFGHAKGAFTGAVTTERGIIQEANGGTLFLDEIDALIPAAQVKLLRFLQEKEYRQLGSAKTLRADVRILAGTNTNLEQAEQTGVFRRDLYYRLNIISMTLPPLRERLEDILPLANHFVDRYSAIQNKAVKSLSPEAGQKLLQHDWPGNVRELQNVIERAVVFSRSEILEPDSIHVPLKNNNLLSQESFQKAKSRVVAEFENRYIQEILNNNNGNITQAAKKSGKNRRAFFELIRKYGIDAQKFKVPVQTNYQDKL